MQINNISQANSLFQTNSVLKNSDQAQTQDSTSSGLSFADTLKEKLDEVNNDQLNADSVTEAFIKGDNVDVHQVMIAATEAQQSLQMAVQVRNKLMDAFQEINRMQL